MGGMRAGSLLRIVFGGPSLAYLGSRALDLGCKLLVVGIKSRGPLPVIERLRHAIELRASVSDMVEDRWVALRQILGRAKQFA